MAEFTPSCTPLGPRPEQRPATSSSSLKFQHKPPTPHPAAASKARMKAVAELTLQGEGRRAMFETPSAEQTNQPTVGTVGNPAELQAGMNYGEVWNEAMVQRGHRQQVVLGTHV